MSGPRGRLTAAVLAAAAAAACVRVDTAPGGIASTELARVAPAIALGDSLRDTTGAAVPVRGVAYDPNGAAVATAGFRYFYVPLPVDTTRGAAVDTALVVDSATGAVRATATWVAQRGRVFARLGSGVQLADTLDIVPPPDSVVVTPPADTVMQYDCRDPRTQLAQDTTVNFKARNTAGPFTVTVRGDSLGTRVGVRRWLVRWSLDSVPKQPIPTDTIPGVRRVPGIAVISGSVDQTIGYDTASSTGASSVRLRIRPRVLGVSYSPDTSFRVVLRVDVIRGAGVPVAGSPVRGDVLGRGIFAVRLYRASNEGCP